MPTSTLPYRYSTTLKPGASWSEEFAITYPADTDLTGVVARCDVRQGQASTAPLLAGLRLGSDLPATANGSQITLVLAAVSPSVTPNKATVRIRLTRTDTKAIPGDSEAFGEIDLLFPNGEDGHTPVEITWAVGPNTTVTDE